MERIRRHGSKTRFVWADGRETWHLTADCPYYPHWTVDVAGRGDLPPGRHEFELVRVTGGRCYYREIGHGHQEVETEAS